jgi:hypothetical protein
MHSCVYTWFRYEYMRHVCMYFCIHDNVSMYLCIHDNVSMYLCIHDVCIHWCILDLCIPDTCLYVFMCTWFVVSDQRTVYSLFNISWKNVHFHTLCTYVCNYLTGMKCCPCCPHRRLFFGPNNLRTQKMKNEKPTRLILWRPMFVWKRSDKGRHVFRWGTKEMFFPNGWLLICLQRCLKVHLFAGLCKETLSTKRGLLLGLIQQISKKWMEKAFMHIGQPKRT